MVTVSIDESTLVLDVEGADKFWALKSQLRIPLVHIKEVVADPDEIHDWWKGLRLYGSYMPGIVIAGTFLYHGSRVFWDVHDIDNAIGIRLHDEHYSELIIEVENPQFAVETIKSAIG